MGGSPPLSWPDARFSPIGLPSPSPRPRSWRGRPGGRRRWSPSTLSVTALGSAGFGRDDHGGLRDQGGRRRRSRRSPAPTWSSTPARAPRRPQRRSWPTWAATGGTETVTDGSAVLHVIGDPERTATSAGRPSGLTSLFGMTSAEATKVGTRWEFWKKGTTQYKNLKSVVSVQSLQSLLPKSKGTTAVHARVGLRAHVDERRLGLHAEAEQHPHHRRQGDHPAGRRRPPPTPAARRSRRLFPSGARRSRCMRRRPRPRSRRPRSAVERSSGAGSPRRRRTPRRPRTCAPSSRRGVGR